MRTIFYALLILLISSISFAAEGTNNKSTWKTIGEIQDTGNNIKKVTIEFRYQGYNDYYKHSIEEANCSKKLIRSIDSKTYKNNGELVKHEIPENKPPYYGYIAPLKGTPSEDIYNAICNQ
jgi:hypothetical protein